MDSTDHYWLRRAQQRRVSRRRFVGGAMTAGAGAAALGLVGCGDDDGGSSTATGTAATSVTSTATAGTASATATGTGTPTAAMPRRGGIGRFVSANNTWDTFDIDRSRFSPVASLFGYTNLGVIHWESFAREELGGGLAEDWELADDTTFVFRLRPNVYWHDKPPVDGRQATAQDVVAFLERNRAGKTRDGVDDPNFSRKALYADIASVTAPDARTVQVTFTRPNPFFLDTLAGAYAKVQAPEAIDQFEAEYTNLRADLVIGTGGFVLVDFAAEGRSRWVRHDRFHAPVYMDGIEWYPLFTAQATQEAAFVQKQIDIFDPIENSVIEDLTGRLSGQITESRFFASSAHAGTYYGGAPPWNNQNLVGAIFRAFDRRTLLQTVLQGKGALAANVPPSQQSFSVTEQELTTFPGYLADRTKDETEARAMWEAGGGPAIGEVVIDIPDTYEGLYSGVSGLITSQLRRVLGNSFVAHSEPYSTINGKVVEQRYGNGSNNIWYGWFLNLDSPEPTVANYLRYNSTSPLHFQFGVQDADVDRLTATAMVELSRAKRQEISKDVVRALARVWGAGVPYNVNGITTRLSWNYLKFSEAAPFVTQHQWATGMWLDTSDPTWQGRAP